MDLLLHMFSHPHDLSRQAALAFERGLQVTSDLAAELLLLPELHHSSYSKPLQSISLAGSSSAHDAWIPQKPAPYTPTRIRIDGDRRKSPKGGGRDVFLRGPALVARDEQELVLQDQDRGLRLDPDGNNQFASFAHKIPPSTRQRHEAPGVTDHACEL
jgi:hypothetical protein